VLEVSALGLGGREVVDGVHGVDPVILKDYLNEYEVIPVHFYSLLLISISG
jgi:hypothetical protein